MQGCRFCNSPEFVVTATPNYSWPDGKITWAVAGDLPGLTRDQTIALAGNALAKWAKVCGIQPQRVDDPTQARIVVTTKAIDGPRGVLGETELPTQGMRQVRLWLDSSDNDWTLAYPPEPGKINLQLVTDHEMGHALGLIHEQRPGVVAVMNPTYNVSLQALQPSDIQAAQARYGPPAATPTPVPTSTPTERQLISIIKLYSDNTYTVG